MIGDGIHDSPQFSLRFWQELAVRGGELVLSGFAGYLYHGVGIADCPGSRLQVEVTFFVAD